MKTILYGIYLGFALGAFGGIHFYNWEFYAIILPTILLVELFNDNYDI